MRIGRIFGLAALIGLFAYRGLDYNGLDEARLTKPYFESSSLIKDIRTGREVRIEDSELSRYRALAYSTIAWSREHGNVIVVSKIPRRLELFNKGKRERSFSIGLGGNPYDDKMYQGDFCTPEGIYEVVDKKEGKRTIFHKALLLDYPRQEDNLEFLIAKQRGLVPKGVNSPGGGIEIHGYGGDFDLSGGCITMKNADIDELFPRVRIGTPVVIVKAY
ncbi:MAG TPA: L,D-transpeptidase [Candidatus Nanoarchaeia archaeon]|nr:L,D-transpeptidase [Candidatus Nanoarchaeia archaeon]